MSEKPNTGRCAICGAELPQGVTSDQCPRCLLALGISTQPASGPDAQAGALQPGTRSMAMPQPGEQFGHYQLVRLLGQGGMGVVYEAEDVESGRRVALKILGQALDSPEARKRFLREGQMAASINHPNSVYVFGTEEIGGTPVIAMELVAGGTLSERVRSSGPLAPTDALDSILQVIAGLEAAQQIGILHRDIKPSNCFVDADGRVKIGDFGLSITTAVRTESNLTATGSLFGTPAFSSPEQLRGEELTLRSDIYAVGVTLYYLLTARMPFEAPNAVQLLATILERRAASPSKLRPGIPKGLASVVLRCLEKDAGSRFESYAKLREALLPYASISPTPATLGLRFVAGIIDRIFLSISSWTISLLIFGNVAAMLNAQFAGKRLLAGAATIALTVLYYGLLEGIWGASAGKAICRLRVARLNRNLPGIPRALLRALIFQGWISLPSLALMAADPEWIAQHLQGGTMLLFSPISFILEALIFVTVRRKNGFAGWHDLWSQTRVIQKSAYIERPGLPVRLDVLPDTAATPQIGPYYVLDRLGESDSGEIVLGYDARLLRKVWIRKLPAGYPPVSPELRNLARPGRLRWLNGQRTLAGSWDAYEAASGRPFLAAISENPGWELVRFWLWDLVEELSAGERTGTLPAALRLDRLWITTEGHLKLLDFAAPGVISTTQAADGSTPPTRQEFIRQVAISALHGRLVGMDEAQVAGIDRPVAMQAHGFVKLLQSGLGLNDLARHLKSLLNKPATETRAHRAILFASSLVLPAFFLATFFMGTRFSGAWRNELGEIAMLKMCLNHLDRLDQPSKPGEAEAQKTQRQQLEIYIASRFQPLVTNTTVWNGYFGIASIPRERRMRVEKIVAAHPRPSAEESLQARKAVEASLKIPSAVVMNQASAAVGKGRLSRLLLYGGVILYGIVPALLCALLFRGGLALHALGIAIVNRKGVPSRIRVFGRTLAVWLPFLLLPLLVNGFRKAFGDTPSELLAVAVVALLSLTSLAMSRSLQDRLAGTYLVPSGDGPTTPKSRRRSVVAMSFAVLLLVLLLAGVAALAPVLKRVLNEKKAINSVTVAREVGEPGKTVPVRVLQADGNPASGARIWIGSGKDDRFSCNAPGQYYGWRMKRLQADANGSVSLPEMADEALIAFTHTNGLLMTRGAKIKGSPAVRLEPWSRIEGVLMSSGQPRAEARVRLTSPFNQSGLSLSDQATTAADGSFLFTNVPPGEYYLYRDFPPKDTSSGGWLGFTSHQISITVHSGEDLKIRYGGQGRDVIGKAAPEDPGVAVDWLNDHHGLGIKTRSAVSGIAEFVRESFRISNGTAGRPDQAWLSSKYKLDFESDGTFCAEDIPPGTYELRIRVTLPRKENEPKFSGTGAELGTLVKEIIVPPGKEPFDLGTQKFPVKAGAAQSVRPLESQTTTNKMSIAGVVLDEEGKPLAGAEITPRGVGIGQTRRWGASGEFVDAKAISDDQGRFVLQCKKKLNIIHAEVEAAGAAPRWAALEPGRDYKIRLEKGVAVTGLVLKDGQPLPGISVGARSTQNEAGRGFRCNPVVTDEKGRFTLANVPSQRGISLFASIQSLRDLGAVAPKDVTTGKSGDIQDIGVLPAQPGLRVAGKIVLPDSASIPEGSRLLLSYEGASDLLESRLGSDGRFEFKGLPACSISISARVKDYHFSTNNPSLDWLNGKIVGQVDKDRDELVLIMERGPWRYTPSSELPDGVDFQPGKKPLRSVKEE